MHDIDKLVRQRAHMVLLAALAMLLWQGSWIAADLLEGQGSILETAAIVATVAGSLAWAAWTIAFVVIGRRIQRSPDCAAVDDEQARLHRLIAFRGGYFVLGVATLLLIPAVSNFGLDALYGIRGVALVGLVAPMIIFGRLELANEPGDEE